MITGISSMATRALIEELSKSYTDRTGEPVNILSIGGVDAAKRVQADEVFDVVVLSAEAIAKLEAAGKTVPGSRVDLVRSGVAVAVKADAPAPAIDSPEAVRQAVLAARSISYSTGPSGVALAQLFERWGIAAAVQAKLVVPPPGTPVGSLVASGQVELGFQQLSELIHVAGIKLLGALPDEIQIITTFSAAVCRSAVQPEAAQALLAFFGSADTAEAKRRQGMAPA